MILDTPEDSGDEPPEPVVDGASEEPSTLEKRPALPSATSPKSRRFLFFPFYCVFQLSVRLTVYLYNKSDDLLAEEGDDFVLRMLRVRVGERSCVFTSRIGRRPISHDKYAISKKHCWTPDMRHYVSHNGQL